MIAGRMYPVQALEGERVVVKPRLMLAKSLAAWPQATNWDLRMVGPRRGDIFGTTLNHMYCLLGYILHRGTRDRTADPYQDHGYAKGCGLLHETATMG